MLNIHTEKTQKNRIKIIETVAGLNVFNAIYRVCVQGHSNWVLLYSANVGWQSQIIRSVVFCINITETTANIGIQVVALWEGKYILNYCKLHQVVMWCIFSLLQLQTVSLSPSLSLYLYICVCACMYVWYVCGYVCIYVRNLVNCCF